MRSFLAVLLLTSAAGLARAQDASLLAGAMRVDKDHGDASFAVNVGYTQRVTPWLALSADYLNEGHPRLHHRDGLGAQVWLHTRVPQRGWSFGAGVGPYYYFDTTTGNGSLSDYRNEHGWGKLASINAVYHLHSRTYVEARLSHTSGLRDRDTTELGFGAYGVRDQLDRMDAEAERVTRLAGLASIGMRYRINDTWRAQLTWNRVITDYHRDSDMFLLGAGVVF